jgi:hypothetical protein
LAIKFHVGFAYGYRIPWEKMNSRTEDRAMIGNGKINTIAVSNLRFAIADSSRGRH